jgi:hypothetical protein
MCHLAALEANRDLDLIPVFEKPLNHSTLEVDVVVIGLRSESDFLEKYDLLALPCLTLFTLLLIFVFSIIEQPTDRRNGGRCHLDQVQVMFVSNAQSLKYGLNPELLTIFVDQSNFANPDSIVDSQILTADR